MEIIETKNGTVYKATVRIKGAKFCKTFKRKVDAAIWKRQILNERDRGAFMNALHDSKSPFQDVCKMWLERKASKKSFKTQQEYKSICNKHFIRNFGTIPLANISIVLIDDLIKSLIGKKRNPKTINKITVIFKQIIKFAIAEKLLRQFPLAEIEMLEEHERPFDFFTDEEIEKMLRASVGTVNHSILIIALNSGLRLGEIFGLKWDKVFLREGFFTVCRKMTRTGLETFTKTKKNRHVGINKELATELHKVRIKMPMSEYVICDEAGLPLSPDHFNARRFKALLRTKKIRELRFHDLRHTYASHYMMNGGSLYDLQAILGHTKSDMTQKYAHLSQAHMIKAAGRVGFSVDEDCKIIEMSPKCPLSKEEALV
jgi:integrase